MPSRSGTTSVSLAAVSARGGEGLANEPSASNEPLDPYALDENALNFGRQVRRQGVKEVVERHAQTFSRSVTQAVIPISTDIDRVFRGGRPRAAITDQPLLRATKAGFLDSWSARAW